MPGRRAAVLTGACDAIFHVPLLILTTTYQYAGSRWIVAPAAVITIAAAGVFYAYLRDRSGSVWPVAIAHNAANTMFTIGTTAVVASSDAALAYVAGETGLATLGSVVVVAAVLLGTAKVWRNDRSVSATEPELASA